jgi:hypothetical protein
MSTKVPVVVWGVLVSCVGVFLIGLGTPGWVVADAESATRARGNVVAVKEDFFVSNNAVRNSIAKCPAGTRVFSGGFAMTAGLQARIFVASPSRSENGYIVYATMPPVNINAGVVKESARITILAYCAPIGQAIVLG